jgi:hypothetical protein
MSRCGDGNPIPYKARAISDTHPVTPGQAWILNLEPISLDTKEEAKEISGLADHAFEKAYDSASNIAEKVVQHEGQKMDKFLEHFA